MAILDADKEGFLRSTRSLIQTIGRAARNVDGTVIMYADQETDSIRQTLEETNRRRELQREYNREHGITPKTVVKAIASLRDSIWEADYVTVPKRAERSLPEVPLHEVERVIAELRREMRGVEGARVRARRRAARPHPGARGGAPHADLT